MHSSNSISAHTIQGNFLPAPGPQRIPVAPMSNMAFTPTAVMRQMTAGAEMRHGVPEQVLTNTSR